MPFEEQCPCPVEVSVHAHKVTVYTKPDGLVQEPDHRKSIKGAYCVLSENRCEDSMTWSPLPFSSLCIRASQNSVFFSESLENIYLVQTSYLQQS